MDASDKDEYLNEADGTLRFTGLDIVAMEDEQLDVEVAVTVQGNVDTPDLGTYEVSVEEMRYLDADNVSTTENDTVDFDFTDVVTFTLAAEGNEDELVVKTNSSDPDAATIKVESDQKSDWITVFVFDIDSDDSVNDIELSNVPVTVETSVGDTYDALVDDARLVIDGVTIDSGASDLTPAGGAAASVSIDFDVDGDVVIDAGDRVKAELQIRFNNLLGGDEGAQVRASVDGDDIIAEGADDLESTQLDGSAQGAWHTLRSQGAAIEMSR